ncbi:MAG: Alpha-amylase family protein [Labilithrix sp.]|nr:Alpha-amylase family protein [Labilithrix sp.]
MHARKTARDAFFPSRGDDRFFEPRRGDIVFQDSAAVRSFAERVNRGEARSSDAEIRPAELAAMALVHEVLHAVVGMYQERHPESFRRLAAALESTLGPEARNDFLGAFPPPPVYRSQHGEGDDTPERYLERLPPLAPARSVESELDEELILLWVTNQNPAYDSVRTIVGDQELGPTYQTFVSEARKFFDEEPRFGPKGETLVDLLLAPSRAHPTSIFAQLEFIDIAWGKALGLDKLSLWRRLAWTQDLRTEEGKWFQKGGPVPGEPLLEAMQFGPKQDEEVARFSPDLNWMPNVVLIAKTAYVWLDQLAKKYGRDIWRLDQVPNEELDQLASRGFNGLWLIGLFERSDASRKVKQMRGDTDALASAYSLKRYDIAHELGGHDAYEELKARAWARGIRLAADMVPNHVGIDGDWVIDHPDWFLQTPTPPFPNYRFGGPDLAENNRVGVYLEEGYWNKTDAAVVFRRHDSWSGENRFIYHGNDGTSMPWNDTAQLDYLQAEVRRAVIETILHVARMFPIIRFDAAMTLAKRHIQRLWYPLPGQGGAIPSRADYAMTQEEFDKAIPVEFWREVVDTVAERAPDTLLLAEAFWMMEGYFVRTLGMHRVYNSAFMNMLKREENDKYRATIKNVLDFDAEILKRFVNFMNNPDEETAVAQFGDTSSRTSIWSGATSARSSHCSTSGTSSAAWRASRSTTSSPTAATSTRTSTPTRTASARSGRWSSSTTSGRRRVDGSSTAPIAATSSTRSASGSSPRRASGSFSATFPTVSTTSAPRGTSSTAASSGSSARSNTTCSPASTRSRPRRSCPTIASLRSSPGVVFPMSRLRCVSSTSARFMHRSARRARRATSTT